MAEFQVYRFKRSTDDAPFEGENGSIYYLSRRDESGQWQCQYSEGAEWSVPKWWNGNREGDQCVKSGLFVPYATSHTDADLAMALQLADLLCKGDLWADDPVGQWLRSRVQRELLSRGAK